MNNTPPADDELDPLYRVVFDDPQNGTPDNITQSGCLALARLGKEAWNAWRQKYPARPTGLFRWKNTADFIGFDFRDETIDFEGFVFDDGAYFNCAQFADDVSFFNAQFGDNASFEQARLGNNANFAVTLFGDNANFANVEFGDSAHFDSAQFGDNTSFAGTRFSDHTSFEGAEFGDNTSFSGAQFGDYTSFSGAQLNDGAIFNDAQFGDSAHFLCAQFGHVAQFGGAQFGKYALFNGAQFNDDALYHCAKFGEQANFCALTWEEVARCYSKRLGGREAAKAWAEARGLSPKVFKSIIFSGVEFAGQVNFSGRAFEGITSFGRLNFSLSVQRCDPEGSVVKKDLPKGHPVVFGKAPLFHNCELHQDTTFNGAKFPKPSTDPLENDIAARAYRTLKLAFAQQQATREEQLFFRLEMAEEAARASRSQRFLFGFYQLVSDYGFSLWRPTVLLVGALLVFLMIYSCLAGLSLCLPWQLDCRIKYDLLEFVMLQALPLPGLDKWNYELRDNLFPNEGLVSVWFLVAMMLHKTISLLAVFLFGLALRNLFKMK